MNWEYLMVYIENNVYVAWDGNSICDSDSDLVILLNKLGQDRWEYCTEANGGYIDYPYHLLKRSIP